MDENQQEVYFDQYCPTCVYKKLEEWKNPCRLCLKNPVNDSTHKPTEWKKER